MIKIEIKGLDKLIRKLGTLSYEIKMELSNAIKKSAFLVETRAKEVTPVDTGRLRASITTAISGPEAIIAPHTEYAIFVHEGVGGRRPRPFMRWGVEQAEPDIQRIFEDAISKVLR